MKLLLQRQKYLIKNMGALMPVPIAAIYVLALPLCIVGVNSLTLKVISKSE